MSKRKKKERKKNKAKMKLKIHSFSGQIPVNFALKLDEIDAIA